MEKVNKKRQKAGLPPKQVSNAAKVNVKSTAYDANAKKLEEEKKRTREENMKKSSEYYSKDSKPGSLRSKADMVKKYNEINKK